MCRKDDSGSHCASFGARCEVGEWGLGQGERAGVRDVRDRRENQAELELDESQRLTG